LTLRVDGRWQISDRSTVGGLCITAPAGFGGSGHFAFRRAGTPMS
jgi:hypothetical protein